MGDLGITKEYLEHVLQEAVEKFEVEPGSNLGDGFLCAMISVNVWRKSKPESENPLSIVIKCYPANASRQEMLDQGSAFVIELGMYKEIIPELLKFQREITNEVIPLPVPDCLYGNYVPVQDRKDKEFIPLDNSIIMPDLRKKSNGGFRLRDRFLGLDRDHYHLIIEAQATLHALSWAWMCKTKKNFETEFPYLVVDWATLMKIFQGYTDGGFNNCLQILKDYPEKAKAMGNLKEINTSVCGLYMRCNYGQDEKGHTKDNLLRIPGDIKEDEEPWEVLLHGDCHSNNHMFRYDEKTGRPVEVVLLDFQFTMVGDPFCDVNFTLFSSGATDLRRKHLESMLHVYYDTFTAICDKFSIPYLPGWSWNEMNRRMRRAKLYGGYVCATTLAIILKNPDELQDLDESADAVDNNGNSNSGLESAAEFVLQLATVGTPSTAFKERLSSVVEDLLLDGVL